MEKYNNIETKKGRLSLEDWGVPYCDVCHEYKACIIAQDIDSDCMCVDCYKMMVETALDII